MPPEVRGSRVHATWLRPQGITLEQRLLKLPNVPAIFSTQEGANINKSLTTLGKVISALAEMVSWLWKGNPRDVVSLGYRWSSDPCHSLEPQFPHL